MQKDELLKLAAEMQTAGITQAVLSVSPLQQTRSERKRAMIAANAGLQCAAALRALAGGE